MGNTVQPGRQESVKPEQTLAVVRAAGVFKAKLNQSKRKTAGEQIEEILEWKFHKKKVFTRKLDDIEELPEQTTDDASKEVLKFVHR